MSGLGERPVHVDILIAAAGVVLGASVFWMLRRDYLDEGRKLDGLPPPRRRRSWRLR